MPKAAMHEYDLPKAGKRQIRGSGKIAPVEPEPVAEGMHQAADSHFGHGILTANAGHKGGTLLPCQPVNHGLAA
jgi:hypothetical protein